MASPEGGTQSLANHGLHNTSPRSFMPLKALAPKTGMARMLKVPHLHDVVCALPYKEPYTCKLEFVASPQRKVELFGALEVCFCERCARLR